MVLCEVVKTFSRPLSLALRPAAAHSRTTGIFLPYVAFTQNMFPPSLCQGENTVIVLCSWYFGWFDAGEEGAELLFVV